MKKIKLTGVIFTMRNLSGPTGYGDLMFVEIDLSKAEYEQ